MKAVILAGGYGTRISEESRLRPKPMVNIGNEPILWHIMKIYAHHGITDFIVCCGYKSYYIKEYFANYFLHRSDVRFALKENRMDVLQNEVEPWTVTLTDTGEKTMTGGRLKRVEHLIGDETFCLTYGDGVSNVSIKEAIAFHRREGRLATLTAVQPPGRFGAFQLERDQTSVPSFKEKPQGDGAWVNGGFFVLEPQVLDYIEGDDTVFEKGPMERLAEEGNLSAYRHKGFWQPMDTLRDKNVLDDLWTSGKAPWKVWG